MSSSAVTKTQQGLLAVYSKDLDALRLFSGGTADLTPLLQASVASDFVEAVRHLLSIATPDVITASRDGATGATLLHRAAEANSAAAIELLLSASSGAPSSSSLCPQDQLKRTPLHLSIAHCCPNAASTLLKHASSASPATLATLLSSADDLGRAPLNDHYLGLAAASSSHDTDITMARGGFNALAKALQPYLAPSTPVSEAWRAKLETAAAAAPDVSVPVPVSPPTTSRLARSGASAYRSAGGATIYIPKASFFTAASSLVEATKTTGGGRPGSASSSSSSSSSARLRTHASEHALKTVAEATGDAEEPIRGILDADLLLALLVTKFMASLQQGIVSSFSDIYELLDSAGDGRCTAGDLASGCLAMGIEIDPSILPTVLERMTGRGAGGDDDDDDDEVGAADGTITEEEFVTFCELAAEAADNAAKAEANAIAGNGDGASGGDEEPV